ncbi:sulfate transport system permease protein [Clostridium sp. DSM 8431]|uniref:sulfate ABC transporter permease subunit CysW n=1 Tax=Clostridium sp. DSM 8431 TaxID=1761781 RepID=UPI0008E1A840|nr:sulfate ABC transporter permease subunit CysW [Clostridium sp. DSM 8431]SFU71273.1 sulfate transport system permease protein [Clostridium sp. DSM 8431]
MKESKVLKWLTIGVSVLFILVMLIIPLIVVITGALKEGIYGYINAIDNRESYKAIELTILVVLVSVILNTIFGLSAAWTITKFKFKGKNILNTLIDLPVAVSPIIAGLMFILTFGRGGIFEKVIGAINLKVIFAVPGIILATIFVTLPYISKEIIPLMKSQGTDEEEAAAMMGASGREIFFKVTLPNIKWGLIYGIILCTSRAMGEFGAVSLVSGHIAGKTNTLPLHIEILYNDYQFAAAFAAASILIIIAVIILVLRNIVEWKTHREG